MAVTDRARLWLLMKSEVVVLGRAGEGSAQGSSELMLLALGWSVPVQGAQGSSELVVMKVDSVEPQGSSGEGLLTKVDSVESWGPTASWNSVLEVTTTINVSMFHDAMFVLIIDHVLLPNHRRHPENLRMKSYLSLSSAYSKVANWHQRSHLHRPMDPYELEWWKRQL